jgi:hypothetical protein
MFTIFQTRACHWSLYWSTWILFSLLQTYFYKFHFGTTLPSVPRSPKWHLPFRFSQQISIYSEPNILRTVLIFPYISRSCKWPQPFIDFYHQGSLRVISCSIKRHVGKTKALNEELLHLIFSLFLLLQFFLLLLILLLHFSSTSFHQSSAI